MVSKSPTRILTRNRSKSPARPSSRPRSTSRSRNRKTRSKTPDLAKARSQTKKTQDKKEEKAEKPVITQEDVAVVKETGSGDTKDIVDGVTRLRALRSYTSATTKTLDTDVNLESSKLKSANLIESKPIVELLSNTHSSKSDRPECISKFATLEALFGVILLLVLTFGVNIICRKKSCSLVNLPDIPKKLDFYLDSTSVLVYLGFICLQTFLAAIPIGSKTMGQNTRLGRHKYCCNGFIALLVTVSILALIVYFKLPWSIVYTKFYALLTCSMITSFVLSLVFFVKSRYAVIAALNSNATSSNFFFNWYEGRELNPRIKHLDFKLLLARIGVIGCFITDICLVLYSMKTLSLENASPTLLTCAGLQLWYLLDYLWHEDNYLTTIDVLQEGVGFKYIMGALTYVNFVPCLIVRFLVMYKIELSVYQLVAISFIYLLGYVIYRSSNSMKNNFRKNPYSSQFDTCETISTSRGKKLLVSGWWGRLRHPNYLGDLIMTFAMSLTCGFDYIIPYYYPIFLFFFLVKRALRDDKLCQKKYGSAWLEYCAKVKYRILPKVF